MSEEKRYVVCDDIQLTVKEYEALCRLSAKFGITKEQALECVISLLDELMFGKGLTFGKGVL